MKYVTGMGVVAQDGRVLGQSEENEIIAAARQVAAYMERNNIEEFLGLALRRSLMVERVRVDFLEKQFTYRPRDDGQIVLYVNYEEQPYGLPGQTFREAIDHERSK